MRVLFILVLLEVNSFAQTPTEDNARSIADLWTVVEAQASLIDTMQAKLAATPAQNDSVVFTAAQIKYLRDNFMNMPGSIKGGNLVIDKLLKLLDILDQQIKVNNQVTDQNSQDVSNLTLYITTTDSTEEAETFSQLRQRADFLRAQAKKNKSLQQGYEENLLSPLPQAPMEKKVLRLK